MADDQVHHDEVTPGGRPLPPDAFKGRLGAHTGDQSSGWWHDCGFDDPEFSRGVFEKLLIMVQRQVLLLGYPQSKFVVPPDRLSYYLTKEEFIWLRVNCFNDGRTYGESVFTEEQCKALKGDPAGPSYAGLFGKWEASATCVTGVDLCLEV